MNARRMLATLTVGAGLVLAPAAHAATTTGRSIVVKCTGAGYAFEVSTPNLPGVPALNAPMGASPCHLRTCWAPPGSSRLWFGKWTVVPPPTC